MWDKKPTDMYAICSAIHEWHMSQVTVLISPFSLVSVETRKSGAQHGILEMKVRNNVHYSSLKKASLSLEKRNATVVEELMTKTLWGRAPSAFQLLKWKSSKADNDAFRVSDFTFHAFFELFHPPHGKTFVFAPQRVAHCTTHVGTPSLMGIREFLVLTGKWFMHHTELAECDIDNAYWELPKDGVLDAIKQAAQRVLEHRGMRGSFQFSMLREGNVCWMQPSNIFG